MSEKSSRILTLPVYLTLRNEPAKSTAKKDNERNLAHSKAV